MFHIFSLGYGFSHSCDVIASYCVFREFVAIIRGQGHDLVRRVVDGLVYSFGSCSMVESLLISLCRSSEIETARIQSALGGEDSKRSNMQLMLI